MRAFYHNEKITQVILPASVNEIDEEAFYGCISLKNNNLENILLVRSRAFSYCGLQHVDLSACKKIEQEAFYFTAFENEEDTSSVVLSTFCTTIEEKAFSGAYLKKFTLPKSIQSMDRFAFSLINEDCVFSFEGTMAEFMKINLDDDWTKNLYKTETNTKLTSIQEIHCSDGVISLQE